MTYNVFGGTLNPAQSNPIWTDRSNDRPINRRARQQACKNIRLCSIILTIVTWLITWTNAEQKSHYK